MTTVYIIDPYEREIREAEYEGWEWVKHQIQSPLVRSDLINYDGDMILSDDIGMLRKDRKPPLFRLTGRFEQTGCFAGTAVVLGPTFRPDDPQPSEGLQDLLNRVEWVL